MRTVIELRQFMEAGQDERYYKGYFIPAMPGWLRVMISKQRADGLIEARNFKVFVDAEGNVLWHKPGLFKVQGPEEFERDLEEFRRMLESAGLLIFVKDYLREPGGRAPS